MKLYTVTMTVHHGDYRHTETAQGVSCEAALLEILKTPMGIGYGANHDTRPAQFEAIAKTLKESGFMQWGWADYSLTMAEPLVRGAGTRLDHKTGQYFPTIDGIDMSPSSFSEDRALEIALEAAKATH